MSPCVGGPSYDQQMEPKRLRAALCGILAVLEGRDAIYEVLDNVDWEEAGVTQDWVFGWWAEHQEADRRRRKREALVEHDNELRTSAIAKLTPEELRALSR